MTNRPNSPASLLPERSRAELAGLVAGIVERGRSALAHVEIELARVEHKVVDARTKLNELRTVLDQLDEGGKRLGGGASG